MDSKGLQTIIVAVVIVVIVAAGAGAYVLASGGSGESGGSTTVEPSNVVPSGVDFVASIKVSDIMGDTDFKSLISEGLSSYSKSRDDTGPEDYQDLLDRFENETGGLDPSGVNSVIIFGKKPGEYDDLPTNLSMDGYTSLVFSAEWSESELVDAIETATGEPLSKDPYKGVTVYNTSDDTPTELAVLSEGKYALGTKKAVRDVIDVQKGNTKGLSGNLKSEMDELGSGLVSFAVNVPESAFSGEGKMSPPGVQEILNKIELISGSVTKSGPNLGVTLRLGASDQSSAESLKNSITGIINLIKGMDEIDSPELKEALNNIEVEKDGSTVTIHYETSIEKLKDLLSGLPSSQSSEFLQL